MGLAANFVGRLINGVSLESTVKFYLWLYLATPGAKAAYSFYMLWAVLCNVRLFAAFYLFDGFQENALMREWLEPWGYRLPLLVINKWILITLMLFLNHAINIFHFIVKNTFNTFPDAPFDLLRLYDCQKKASISISERILGGYLIERDRDRMKSFAVGLRVDSCRFGDQGDIYKAIHLGQLIEVVFVGVFVVLIGAHVCMGVGVCWLYLSVFGADLTRYKAFRYVFDTATGLIVNSFVGTWIPFGMGLCVYFYLRVPCLPFDRTLGKLAQRNNNCNKHHSIVLDLKSAKRMFVHLLVGFVVIDHEGMRRFFTVSVASTMCGSLFASLYLMIGQVEANIRLFISFILGAAFLAIFMIGQTLISSTDNLYRFGKILRRFSFKHFPGTYSRDLTNLKMFLEITTPKKPFLFKFSVFGSVSHKNLVLGFFPLYTSLLFFVIPLLKS